MKVREYSDPRPHIIIENVFDEKTVDSFLQEVVEIDDKFKQGIFVRNDKSIVDRKQKAAFDLGMDIVYKNRRSESFILKTFDNFFWSKDMQKVYENSKYPCFNFISRTKTDNTHIIRYSNTGDHYSWHNDIDGLPYGFTTMSFMLCSKKQKFKGGDFQLKFKKKIKTIPFKRNTMVIFPRICQHKATNIILK